VMGAVGVGFWMAGSKPVEAGNDRHEDYVLCTGPVAALQHVPTDGVWLLDYRSGKLLGTVINRTIGKIIGWAEVDLVAEFSIPPRQNVHFLMTSRQVGNQRARPLSALPNPGGPVSPFIPGPPAATAARASRSSGTT